MFSQLDDSSEILSGSGWFSLGSGSAGEASQLKILAKLNEAVTENGRWYIGLFNLREDGTSIWSVFDYPRPEQPKYCFNPADTDQFLDIVLNLPAPVVFEEGKLYEAYLAIKSKAGEFRVCENNDDVGSGNESSAIFKADPSGNIFFQIGTGF